MRYWICTLTVSSVIPVLLIVFGTLFSLNFAKKRNSVFCYRSRMAQKSQKTVFFANAYCGKLWQSLGIWMLPVVFVLMLWFKESSEHTLGLARNVICCTEFIFLVISVIHTEIALRKYFYSDGTSRKW